MGYPGRAPGTGPDISTYYRCFSPTPVPLVTLVRVAGSRRRVEGTFQSGKGSHSSSRLDQAARGLVHVGVPEARAVAGAQMIDIQGTQGLLGLGRRPLLKGLGQSGITARNLDVRAPMGARSKARSDTRQARQLSCPASMGAGSSSRSGK